jgi:hypothetical protein
MRVPDYVLKSVVFIGEPIWTRGRVSGNYVGTGFFVGIPYEPGSPWAHTYLVTARHVIEPLLQDEYLIRINLQQGGSNKITVGYKSEPHWTFHPDPIVDVAITPWKHRSIYTLDTTAVITAAFLTAPLVQQGVVGVGDEIFATGLFRHVYGEKRNIPIVRSGNVAMIEADRVPTKHGDIDAYLVEVRSIGGLSGSPVFVRGHDNQIYLMGLMHGHWDVPSRLDATEGEKQQPPTGENQSAKIKKAKEPKEAINMGIGIVIPASKILQALFLPEFVELRRRADEERRNEQNK